MNKTELIEKIAAGSNLTKAQSKAALDETVKAIKEALIAGDKISLVPIHFLLPHRTSTVQTY